MKFVQSAVAALLLGSAVLAAQADTYVLDPVHTSAIFRIKHEVAYFYGRFDAAAGTIEFDPAHPEATKFEVTLDANKINTGNENRDNHVKSPAFLNAKEFGTLTFKSTSVKKDGDALQVTGDLTIHGVTKPLTVKLDITGTGKNMDGKPVVGFEGEFSINRSDFGVKEFPGVLGDDVRFIISIEATNK